MTDEKTEKKILTREELWPPCERCFSDGFPADIGKGNSVSGYLCFECNIDWGIYYFAKKTHQRQQFLINMFTAKAEILALRDDPTSFSFRGFGPYPTIGPPT